MGVSGGQSFVTSCTRSLTEIALAMYATSHGAIHVQRIDHSEKLVVFPRTLRTDHYGWCYGHEDPVEGQDPPFQVPVIFGHPLLSNLKSDLSHYHQ